MRLAILTTETPHHCRFVREIAQRHHVSTVVSQTELPRPPFPTHHGFEDDRDAFECDRWFDGHKVALSDFAPITMVRDINDHRTATAIQRQSVDATIVFGTTRIGPEIINLCSGRLVNLHGGDIEEYRGLDTALWAIYHRQPDQLAVTLHHVVARLDAGGIIATAQVIPEPESELLTLRALITEQCEHLTLIALDNFDRRGTFESRMPRRLGRYYSSMPFVLKSICVEHYRRFTRSLACAGTSG